MLLVASPAQHLPWWLSLLIAAQVLIGLLSVKALSEYRYLAVSFVRAHA